MKRSHQSLKSRAKALEVTRDLKQKDYRGEACRCLEFCRDKIRYVRDIYGIETVHPPDYVLNIGAGDCDDKAVLLAAMLSAIGHRVRFIAIAFKPNQFSHVWLQDYIGGQWVDLEPTEPLQCGKRIPHRAGAEYIYCDV